MAGTLRGPGAIVLISTYELGRQPLSLASPCALLRGAGFAPATVDLAVERLDPALLEGARLVAISVPMHTALRLGVRAVERIRSIAPGCRVVLYGLYASLNAGPLLERGADFVIGGEYEEPLRRLAEDLDAGGTGCGVPGVGTSRESAAPWIHRIEFAVPQRATLPALDRYARLQVDDETRLAGQTETSRGCLHLCRHCPIPPVYAGRFFTVPREIVLADIRAQVAAGATHITFGDADFLNGPGHAMPVLRAARAEHPALTFDVTAKIEHLLKHRDLLPEMARLGCLFIVSAVESIDDRVLRILDKGHTRADVETVLELTRGAGIALRPSLLPFTPWLSYDGYLELLEFVDRHELISRIDPVQLVLRLLLPPGSLLLGLAEMRPHLGPFDPDRFTYTWSHPDPRMDRLQPELAALVEGAAAAAEDPWATFERARHHAASVAGMPAPRARPARRPPGGAASPRLTEPWFCCAEPTEGQMERLVPPEAGF